jgi:hypothetical protein
MKNDNEKMVKLYSYLLWSSTQSQIFHRQTKGYLHTTLNEYYSDLIDSYDALIEAYQGKYGLLTGMTNLVVKDFEKIEDVIEHLTIIAKQVEQYENTCEDSYIISLCDDILKLVYSTKYKLTDLCGDCNCEC